MNILNNGRFGMAACLSGTMKSCITAAVSILNKYIKVATSGSVITN